MMRKNERDSRKAPPKDAEDENALDLIPLRCCEWKKNDDGHVTLLMPRFKQAWMRRFAARLGRSENLSIHLDDTGSRVWELVDGRRRIEEIGQAVPAKEGESDQQKYERLTTFMMILERNKFIRFQE